MIADAVSHKGKVVSVEGGKVRVEIVSESACAACHASGLCGIAESRKKIVEVPSGPARSFEPGQEVEVCLARKTGMKAVLLSYVVPVVILLILILSLPLVGLGELATGGLSVLGVAFYYLVLYFFRDRLAEGYEFFIRN